MSYKRPQAEPIETTKICEYGCLAVANYKFYNGKLCCSKHHNSCQGKRNLFSKLDHSDRTAKSLATRIEKGITKSSQIKGGKTRRDSGHYEKLAETMQEHWANHPWDNNMQCPLLKYKTIDINYQGTYEYKFLESLELENNLEWISKNVSRGPSIWYIDPEGSNKKLYISDFIIDNTIFEIKSSWTWDRNGKNSQLREKNKAKLTECVSQGYNVVLVLNNQRIEYARVMDGVV